MHLLNATKSTASASAYGDSPRKPAQRLFKRAQRGRQKPLRPSPQGEAAGRTAEEDAAKHFSSLFASSEEVPIMPQDLTIAFDSGIHGIGDLFTAERIKAKLKGRNHYKSCGKSGMHILMLKTLCLPPKKRRRTDPDEPSTKLPVILEILFSLCGATGLTPTRWGTAIVSLLGKANSNVFTPETARPIALLEEMRKLFELLFAETLVAGENNLWCKPHPAQAGFRKGWSCHSHILLLAHRSKPDERHSQVYLDLHSAYTTVRASVLDAELKKKGAPVIVRRLVWSMMLNGASIELVVNGRRLAAIPVRSGLPQGSVISPFLFNIFINPLIEALNEGCAADDPNSLWFADDGVLSSSSYRDLRVMLDKCTKWANARGMRFNVNNCGVVSNDPKGKAPPFRIQGHLIPVVASYKYLGISRGDSGIDVPRWLTDKADGLTATPRLLQVVGFGWSPYLKLHLYRSMCYWRMDFAGGVAHIWLAASSGRPPGLSDLDKHYDEAVKWICGTNRAQAAQSITALPRPEARCGFLALGLAVHLRNLAEENPAAITFRRILSRTLDEESADLLPTLAHSSTIAAPD